MVMKCCVYSLLFLLIGTLTTVGQERPNILIVLADDLGFSDLGCYGGEIKTPHLDGLAAGGVRFSQFYNTGRCWPTRGSLLTGFTLSRSVGINFRASKVGLEVRGRLGLDWFPKRYGRSGTGRIIPASGM